MKMIKSLEHMSYMRRLRGLGLVSLENAKCLMTGSKEDRVTLFSAMPRNKPKRWWAQTEIPRNSKSPSLEIFKSQLDVAMGNVL